MKRSFDWHIDLSLNFDPFAGRGLLVLALLFVPAGELASENVTLTTYYPAPSGVYSQMITTGNTYLARDGGQVGIGTPTADAKLAITSTAAGAAGVVVHGASGDTWFPYTDGKNYIRGTTVLADTGGRVGIGTSGPAASLDVAGTMRFADGSQAPGLVLTSDASGNAHWAYATYAP
jgi:hypothetical protein